MAGEEWIGVAALRQVGGGVGRCGMQSRPPSGQAEQSKRNVAQEEDDEEKKKEEAKGWSSEKGGGGGWLRL